MRNGFGVLDQILMLERWGRRKNRRENKRELLFLIYENKRGSTEMLEIATLMYKRDFEHATKEKNRDRIFESTESATNEQKKKL